MKLPTLLFTSATLVASLLAFPVSAQCSTANAVGIWRSDNFNFTNFTITPGYPAGTAGNRVWQVLPPELCIFFKCGSGNRELDFRGVELNVTYKVVKAGGFDAPKLLITDQLISVPGTPTRYGPAPAASGFSFPSVPAAVNGSSPNLIYRLVYNITGSPFVVKPGTKGVAFVWEDYESQYGSGNSLQIVATTTEPVGTGTDADHSYSGYTPKSTGILTTLANFNIGGQPKSGEFCITWYFDQSMIQPIRNSFTVTGAIPASKGGGAYPAGIIHITSDDGRGALFPQAGDIVSYSGNSNVPPVMGSPRWFVPFVLYSGSVAGFPFEPAPETWASGDSYIYKQTVQDWFSDASTLFTGSPLSPTGGPTNCNFGIWLGVDLPLLFNATVLVESLNFADVTSVRWAGPTLCVYDQIKNPAGVLDRNLVNMAGSPYAPPLSVGLREQRSLLSPFSAQVGYSPIEPAAGGPPNSVGFATVPASLYPNTFSIQCWILSLGGGASIQTTNAVILRLQ